MKALRLLRTACAMLLAAQLALNCPVIARAVEPPAVEKRVVSHGDTLVDVNGVYPEVSGLADNSLAGRINLRFSGAIQASIQEVTQAAKADAQDGAERSGPYQASSNFQVFRNDGEFLSICMQVDTYEGGAHGGSYCVCVNASCAGQGALISLEDLFVPDCDYMRALNERVIEWISQDKWLLQDHYFEGVRADQSFYLTDQELVLVFDEYEIAPYAYGMPEVRIPFSALSELLIPELKI